MEFKPHNYQLYCINQILNKPFCGLFLDMGLGKTVITLTALHELKYYRFSIRKTLIIAPKKVAEATWTDEAKKWDHLQGLRFSLILGTAEERLKATQAKADIYIINRDNVAWLVDQLGTAWPFDCVILDESSSFKNYRSKRFRAVRSIRGRVSRLVLLTGTPDPHGLTDLWAQVYLLDGGKRLGRTISVYRDMYFIPDKRSAAMVYSYRPKEGAQAAIYDAIKDICISMSAKDYLQLPPYIVDDVPVMLDAGAREKYKKLESTTLLNVDDSTITAASAGVLTGKLLQLCNGAVYDDDLREVVEIHRSKITALLELIEGLQGQHAIIYYHFKHDLARITEALDGCGLQVRTYNGAEDAEAWNAGEVDLLLAHPASCGYGLNLQQGGHHIIWFGLTYALEEYLQANARLYRQGQTCPVIVHRLITKGGIDEAVIRSLEGKDATQQELLQALKAKVQQAQHEAAEAIKSPYSPFVYVPARPQGPGAR